METLGKVT